MIYFGFFYKNNNYILYFCNNDEFFNAFCLLIWRKKMSA